MSGGGGPRLHPDPEQYSKMIRPGLASRFFCVMDSNAGQKAEPAVEQTPDTIISDNQKEVPASSSSTPIDRWRKAVRKTTNIMNLQKRLNAMPIGKPVLEPFEISMYDPRCFLHNTSTSIGHAYMSGHCLNDARF